MRSFLAGWLPLLVAGALVLCLYSVRSHLTRFGSWQRLVTWPLPLLAFLPVWIGGSALVLSLVGGNLKETYRMEGAQGTVDWQERSVVMLREPDLQRQWFDIVNVSGKRIAKVDNVKWLAVQTDIVEVLGVGRDFVWLRGKQLGLHTRDLYTGNWLRGQQELIGDVQLAENPFRYNAATRKIDVATKDGRTLHIDAK